MLNLKVKAAMDTVNLLRVQPVIMDGKHNMKITLKQLKRVIKEEVQRINESFGRAQVATQPQPRHLTFDQLGDEFPSAAQEWQTLAANTLDDEDEVIQDLIDNSYFSVTNDGKITADGIEPGTKYVWNDLGLVWDDMDGDGSESDGECEICGDPCPVDWNLCGDDECLNDEEEEGGF